MSLLTIEYESTRVGSLGDFAELNLIECPGPGIYPDMDATVYHRIHAASNSKLKHLQKSPAHLLEAIIHPASPTAAMTDGSAIHARVLEPERFSSEFAVMRKVDGRTKEGKAYKENFEIENLGKAIITEETAELCERIYESFSRSPLVMSMLEAPGAVEASAFWKNEDGVQCKMRLDKAFELNGEHIILDLKTTDDASLEGFQRSILKYGYHIQGAMYPEGYEAAGGGHYDHFIILAVEKTPPFAFNLYRIDDDVLDIGRREYRRLAKLYKQCIEQDFWPGYLNPLDEMISPISLPSWAMRGELSI